MRINDLPLVFNLAENKGDSVYVIFHGFASFEGHLTFAKPTQITKLSGRNLNSSFFLGLELELIVDVIFKAVVI
jgi:hypothetical protein